MWIFFYVQKAADACDLDISYWKAMFPHSKSTCSPLPTSLHWLPRSVNIQLPIQNAHLRFFKGFLYFHGIIKHLLSIYDCSGVCTLLLSMFICGLRKTIFGDFPLVRQASYPTSIVESIVFTLVVRLNVEGCRCMSSASRYSGYSQRFSSYIATETLSLLHSANRYL